MAQLVPGVGIEGFFLQQSLIFFRAVGQLFLVAADHGAHVGQLKLLQGGRLLLPGVQIGQQALGLAQQGGVGVIRNVGAELLLAGGVGVEAGQLGEHPQHPHQLALRAVDIDVLHLFNSQKHDLLRGGTDVFTPLVF